ncbi:helix-turn-helix transcriptional regulator [Glycomyces sp. NPDC047369]
MTADVNRLIFGRVVRSLRERAERGRIEFAEACHTSPSHLRNIENGHKSPSPALLEDLERELDTQGLLTDLATCGESSMRRRIVLQSLALLGAAIPEAAFSEGTIGTAQVDVVRSMTATLRGIDSLHGGIHANHSITAYLHNVALPMLDQPHTSKLKTDLFSSVAELALLAGWSAFDAGVQSSARACFTQALKLADEANNTELGCETTIAISNQAAILSDGPRAVTAAQAALDAAESISSPALIGEARMALAHGEAVNGNTATVASLITQASCDMDRADRPDGPPWISHVGNAWFEGRIAQCLHLTGDRTNAAAAAEQTATNARPLPRGNVLNLGHTALVMFAADRPEEAAIYARQALKSAEQVQSARVEEYMTRLEVAAARYDNLPEVADLRTALSTR